MKFLVSMFFYGTPIIVLGFFAGHPVTGVLIALYVVLSLYFSTVFGILNGAETALRNPPPIGETQITMKVFGREVNISEEFIFSPPETNGRKSKYQPMASGGRNYGSLNNGLNINDLDVMQWHKEAKRILDEEGHKEFVAFCKEAGQNESTVRSRIKKYFVKN